MTEPRFVPRARGWPRIKRSAVHRIEGSDFQCNGIWSSVAFGEVQFADNIRVFQKEPAGDGYQALLEVAKAHCFAFSLVWRDQLAFDRSALSLVRWLRPWLCYEQHTDRWPGTTLLDTKAWVRCYRITEPSLSVVVEQGRLFAWHAPRLPEDLAFYCESGAGWVGSTSHEELGWLDLESIDLNTLREGPILRSLWTTTA